MVMNAFFTVGHSTHTIDEFVALLRGVDVELVADVRTIPRSRTNSQYDRDVLPTTLKPLNLGYMHIPELGGLRSRTSIAPDVNGFWRNEASTTMLTTPWATGSVHGCASYARQGTRGDVP